MSKARYRHEHKQRAKTDVCILGIPYIGLSPNWLKYTKMIDLLPSYLCSLHHLLDWHKKWLSEDPASLATDKVNDQVHLRNMDPSQPWPQPFLLPWPFYREKCLETPKHPQPLTACWNCLFLCQGRFFERFACQALLNFSRFWSTRRQAAKRPAALSRHQLQKAPEVRHEAPGGRVLKLTLQAVQECFWGWFYVRKPPKESYLVGFMSLKTSERTQPWGSWESFIRGPSEFGGVILDTRRSLCERRKGKQIKQKPSANPAAKRKRNHNNKKRPTTSKAKRTTNHASINHFHGLETNTKAIGKQPAALSARLRYKRPLPHPARGVSPGATCRRSGTLGRPVEGPRKVVGGWWNQTRGLWFMVFLLG